MPGTPIVVRKAVVTRHFAATEMRSWWRISLLTAAAISGVSPVASAVSAWVSAAGESSQSRSPPTVSADTGVKAARSWVSRISRVTSSVSYGTTGSSRNASSGTSASARWAATRSAAEVAATPARTSPERSGRGPREQRAQVREGVGVPADPGAADGHAGAPSVVRSTSGVMPAPGSSTVWWSGA